MQEVGDEQRRPDDQHDANRVSGEAHADQPAIFAGHLRKPVLSLIEIALPLFLPGTQSICNPLIALLKIGGIANGDTLDVYVEGHTGSVLLDSGAGKKRSYAALSSDLLLSPLTLKSDRPLLGILLPHLGLTRLPGRAVGEEDLCPV